MDEFETYADVIDAYNANDMGYSSLTDYIKGQNIKIKEISMEPLADLQRSLFENKADGGMIGIEVLFGPKRDDFSIGGRARPADRVYDSRANVEDFTKALKSVSAGTTYQQQADAQRYARNKANEMLTAAMRSGNQSGIQSIFQGVGGPTSMGGMQFNRSGNRITGVPATGPGRDKILNAMAQQMLNTTPSYQSIKPQPRDNLGLLMSETIVTDKMRSPAEMEAIRQKVLAAQKAQEQSYFMTDPVTGKKYSSEAEAIDDLGLVTYNQRFADGGRVGLFMGGPPLEGQALSIYNSMNAYGFSDQEIADALRARGLYTPGGTTQPEQVTGIINQQIQTGGGGGDGGPQGIATPKQYFDKTYVGDDPNYTGPTTFPDGTPIMGGFEETKGPGFLDSIANAFSGLAGLYQKFSPIGMISRKIEQNKQFKQAQTNKAIEQAEIQRKIREAEEAAAAAALANAKRIGRMPTAPSGDGGGGVQDSGGPTGGYSYDSGGREGFGYGLKDGGVATMFTRRR